MTAPTVKIRSEPTHLAAERGGREPAARDGNGLRVQLLWDPIADAVVRAVLVPATMKLLGRWNWYLPRWLGWLPRVSVESPTRATAPAVPTARGIPSPSPILQDKVETRA